MVVEGVSDGAAVVLSIPHRKTKSTIMAKIAHKPETPSSSEFTASTFRLDMIRPEFLVVIGRDTHHKRGEHALYDERAFYEATPEEIAGVVDMNNSISPIPCFDEVVPFDMLTEDFVEHARATAKALAGHVDGPKYAAIVASFDAKQPTKLKLIADGRQRKIAAEAANDAYVNRGTESGVWLTVATLTGTAADQRAVMIAAAVFAKPVTVAQKARLYADWKDANGGEKVDRTSAARQFNCTNEQIRRFEMFLGLEAEVQSQVDSGKLSFEQAIKLHGADRDAQLEAAGASAAAGTPAEAGAAVENVAVAVGTAIKAPPVRLLVKLAAKMRKDWASLPATLKNIPPMAVIEFVTGSRDASKLGPAFEAYWNDVGAPPAPKPAKEPKADKPAKEPKGAKGAAGKVHSSKRK